MSKKQIKDLVIRLSSENGESTAKLITNINSALEAAKDTTAAFNKQIGGSVKVIQNIEKSYSNMEKTVVGLAKGFKSLNTAINSSTTATGAKRIRAFTDDIELATLYIRDLATESEKASASLNNIVSSRGTGQMQELINIIERIEGTLIEMSETTERSEHSMTELIHTMDRLGDKIVDVEVGVKKARIQTERGSAASEELARQMREQGTQTDRVRDKTEGMTNALRRLNAAGSSSARGFSSLAFGMNPLVSIYASIAVNVYALSEAFRVLKDAASLNRLYNETARFSAGISGINIEGLSVKLTELSGNAINAGDALRQAVRGVSYGFAVSELEALTEGARKASVALGIDFQDAYDRAIRGIAKQEVELLDEIGVVTRLDTAMQKYARTLGVTADSLTDMQRTAALTTEVIAQLDDKFSDFSTNATGMEKLGVATSNLVDSFLMGASTALDPFADKLAKIMGQLSGNASGTKLAAQSLKTYNEALSKNNMQQAIKAHAEYTKALALAKRQLDINTPEGKAAAEQAATQAKAIEYLNATIGLGILVAAKYAVVTLATMGTALVSTTARIYTSIAAWVALKAVQLATQIRSLLVARAILTASGSMGVMTLASWALAGGVTAVATGLWAAVTAVATFVGGVALIVGVVAAAGYGIYKLTEWLMGSAGLSKAFKAVGDGVSWLWEKLKGLLGTITSMVGLDNLTDGLKEGGAESAALAKELAQVQASIQGINGQDLAGFDRLAEKMGAVKLSMQEIQSLYSAGLLGEDAVKLAMEGADLSAQRFVKTAGGIYVVLDTLATPILNLEKGLTATSNKIKDIGKGFAIAKTPLEEMGAGILELLPNLEQAFRDDQYLDELKNTFKGLQDAGFIDSSIAFSKEAIQAYGEQVLAVANSQREYEQTLININNAQKILDYTVGSEESARIGINTQLAAINEQIRAQQSLTGAINAAALKELNIKREQLVVEQSALHLSQTKAAIDEKYTNVLNSATNALSRQTTNQSELLGLEISILESKILAYGTDNLATQEIRKQIALLKEKQDFAKADEARALAALERDKQTTILEGQMSSAGTATAKAAIAKELLAIEEARVNAMSEGIEKRKAEFDLEQQRLASEKGTKAAPSADFSAIAGSMAGFSGLTDLQSTALDSMSSISGIYSDFLADTGNTSKSFMEFLKGDIDAFSSVASAGLDFAQGAFAAASQAKVDSLNREIEAEKRRDGKSAESKAKIKALEAKRIKEEAKAKKASIIMSTATAVMQGYAQGGPIVGSILAVPTIAMGLMQLSQIDKATSGSLAGLNDSGSNLEISGGNRSNEVNVANKANAGELAYLQGSSGTGSIGNFTPGRAGGGFSAAGTGIVVGESGPELITPAVPVNVNSAGNSRGSNTISFAPVFNLSSVDSMGMDELLQKYSTSLYNGLEKELQARNLTLENL